MQALDQLRTIEIPSSRDEIDHLRFEAAIDQGLAVTSATDHHIKVGEVDVVVKTTVSQIPSGAQLPSVYPEPLATLMGEIGPSLWVSLRAWADKPDSRNEIDELLQFGVPTTYESIDGRGPMRGMVFVFAGTLKSMTREQARRAVEQAGGKVHGSASESTTAVVAGVGANGGPKLRRAAEYDADIWTEDEFLVAIGEHIAKAAERPNGPE